MRSHFKLLLLMIILSQNIHINSLSAITVDKVLAIINNEMITLSDYKKYNKEMGNIENDVNVDQNILKQLIEEKIILLETEKKGIEVTQNEIKLAIEEFKKENNLTDEELEDILKDEKISLNDFKNNLRNKIKIAKLIQSEVDSKIIITEKEISDYYEKNKTNFIESPLSILIKAIFLKIKENASVTELTDLKIRALKISSLLKEGDSFDRLILEYSDEPLKSNNGLLGIFHKGTLLPALEKKAFSMKKGEISEPIWVENGVYIIQVVDIFPEVYKPLESVKDDIYNILFNNKKISYYNNWVKTLWEKMSIKILEN
jgi:parvulin-like peptidyl-prolyl isomerase